MEIRASDEDRQRVVAALERHTGAGRLTLDEFAARVEVAVGARTMSELAAVTSDLPAADDQPRRELFLVFLIAIVTLMLLGAFIALRS
ncbi:DUF1707 domain-containing protein [Actinoplanes sp. NBRC 103695]|uniref:DUF1707 SHOCT-like domain-containing protein n=1 Tax=Actinoplanes sp. NBRC 103695 TaxID=3032202 RepID=UPI0024A2C2C9|nr:DUF1707 domain-containing protein [Actinoplanes sp. NBRC 103695]GLY96367.1 hypothetical protein Acsp02_36220 [Actinoplanes sp. NBRC 103695]